MSDEVKPKRSITVGVSAPAWMGSDVIVGRMHKRVQTIMNGVSFRAPDEIVQAVANLIIEGYIGGYGDGRGMLEQEQGAEEHAQHIADVIIAGEGGTDDGVEGPDFLAIADFVRRVAGIIEQRGLVQAVAGAPKGLPS
jgi:hypothetical protein